MNIVHSFIYLNLIQFALVLIHKFIQASQVAQWRIYPSMQEIQETWVWSLGTLTYNKIKQKRLGSFTNSPTCNICRVIRFGNGSYITIRDQRMDKKCVGFPRDTGLVGSNPMSVLFSCEIIDKLFNFSEFQCFDLKWGFSDMWG